MSGSRLESRKCVRHWMETKKRETCGGRLYNTSSCFHPAFGVALATSYFSALWKPTVDSHGRSSARMQQSPCDQKFQMHGLYFTCLLKPLERHIHGSVQRSGSSLYCLGKENILKNVSGLNDCQLLQRREDKTGRPLMVFYEQESLTVPETFSYKTYCITLLDPSALIGWRFCPHQSDAAWFNSSYDKGGLSYCFAGVRRRCVILRCVLFCQPLHFSGSVTSQFMLLFVLAKVLQLIPPVQARRSPVRDRLASEHSVDR